jgi:hypothetical protein
MAMGGTVGMVIPYPRAELISEWGTPDLKITTDMGSEYRYQSKRCHNSRHKRAENRKRGPWLGKMVRIEVIGTI